MANQLTKMARELLAIESDLPYRIYDDCVETKRKHTPSIDEYELHVFSQTWGSTTLGFDGIGGQAMTAANTYVFLPPESEMKCYVYFAGRFAYAADYTKEFYNDVKGQRMESVRRSRKYRNQD